jgi:hypothetical protein
MDEFAGSENRDELPVGTRVDVHTRYDLGRWAPGFTIAGIRADGYRIRRCSDGSILKETIRSDEVRIATPVPTRSHEVARTRTAQLERDHRTSGISKSGAER